MAGAEQVDESQFKGLSKYFNSVTLRGRANVRRIIITKLHLTNTILAIVFNYHLFR